MFWMSPLPSPMKNGDLTVEEIRRFAHGHPLRYAADAPDDGVIPSPSTRGQDPSSIKKAGRPGNLAAQNSLPGFTPALARRSHCSLGKNRIGSSANAMGPASLAVASFVTFVGA